MRASSRARAGAAAAVLALMLAPATSCAPADDPPDLPGSPKPISLAILEDYDKGQDLSAVARDFGLFHELGITTWRGSFGWDDYEPEPGRYDFAWLREFVELARDSGITLRPYIAYTPAWAGRTGADGQAWNDPPRNLDRWRRFVDTLAASIGAYDNVASWEIYNEENVPLWWEGTLAEYSAVLAAAAERIRARDPGAEVLIGGTVWPDSDWLEGVCEVHGHAGSFDVAPFHAYPETWPDTLDVEAYLDEHYRRWYLAAVDSACGGKPVWINEAGYATTPGRSERQQADWWARAFATFFAAPRVEHLGVYEIRDLRPESDVIGDAPNYYLGLVRTDGTPKLAFRTVRLLARLFAADSVTVATDALELAGDPGLVRHLFVMPDGRQLVFVWDSSAAAGAHTVGLTVPRHGRSAERHALDGTSRPLELGSGRRSVELTLEPGDIGIVEVLPALTGDGRAPRR